jgi:hypothetical protein
VDIEEIIVGCPLRASWRSFLRSLSVPNSGRCSGMPLGQLWWEAAAVAHAFYGF